MRHTLAALATAAVFAAALAGCGQKGPLYLPVTPPRTIPPMPPQAPVATTRHPAQPAHPPAQPPPSGRTSP
ncbi:MAG: LPS translocon maturation chaperone LptM [Gammaproteobacteria bacterium]